VRVSVRVLGPLAVEVDATFHCPDPRTIVMTIIEGEGVGSVVETHATPIGPGRTAVIEATLATLQQESTPALTHVGLGTVLPDLDDATEAVALAGGVFDGGDHGGFSSLVETANRAFVDLRQVSDCRALNDGGAGVTHLDDVRDDIDPDGLQQQLGQGPGGNARRGLAGTGTLENVTGIVESVLLHAGEVGVAGPGLRERILGDARRR
jgi:hypothetical protein